MPKQPVIRSRKGAKRAAEPENNLSSSQVRSDASQIAAEIIHPTEDNVNIRVVLSTIEGAFSALGTEELPGTIIPAGAKNNAKEAAEFVIADRLSKLATERLKKAHEVAEKAGVFGNKDDYIAGDTVMVFSDPNFSINVKMGKPSRMVNRELVEANAAEFLGKRSTEFLDRCFKPRAATKQIIVSMK